MSSGGDLNAIERQLANEAAEIDRAFEAQEAQLAHDEVAMQAESNARMLFTLEETVNPLISRFNDNKEKKMLEERRNSIKASEKERLEKRLAPIKEIEAAAERFSRKNAELRKQILVLLLDKVKGCKDKDELRRIVSQFYLDPTLADDAMDFLLATTVGDLNKIVQEAKEEHNKQFGREIQAGRNIQSEVLKATTEKLGTPTSLRELYRDITGNPREPVVLFLELSDHYSYQDLRKILAFLFHSLGADLKSQGPSIQAGLLYRLLSEVRSLQAILGVYRFFRSRMGLINTLFQKNNLEMPPQLNFENISRQFVGLLQERYPSGDKVLVTAGRLGIEKWILAKIIVLSQLRDAIREVALQQLYRSIDHRNELYNAIIEALEELEEELDELMDQDSEEKKKDDEQEEKTEQDEKEG